MKTPQEKKRLSYAKDRRNVYGEHDKGSRKTIRANKLHQLRAQRRAQNRALLSISEKLNADELSTAENHLRAVPPRQWRKCPDRPLGEVLPWKLAKRAATIGAKLARRKRHEA